MSLESLATQFEAADGKRGPENAVKRESKDKGPDKKKLFSDTNSEFDPFDFDKMSNY